MAIIGELTAKTRSLFHRKSNRENRNKTALISNEKFGTDILKADFVGPRSDISSCSVIKKGTGNCLTITSAYTLN